MSHAAAEEPLYPSTIARSAVRRVFQLRGALVTAALTPLVLFVALDSAVGLVTESEWRYVFAALYQAPVVLFAVLWHRVILAGVRPTLLGPLAWSRVHSAFLLYGLVIWLLSEVVDRLPSEGSAVAAMLMLGPVAVYIEARVAPLLPSAAVGGTSSPIVAWALSNGNGWRLALTGLMAALLAALLSAPVWLAALALGPRLQYLGKPATLIAAAVYDAAYLFGLAIEVTALSLAFQHLSGPTRAAQHLSGPVASSDADPPSGNAVTRRR